MMIRSVEPVPDEELLKLACEFDLGPQPLMNGKAFWWEGSPQEARLHGVRVTNMGNPDENGPDRWAIRGSVGCLNKEGWWEYEPQPSSRDEDFFLRCRYSSAHEAIRYYWRWKAVVEKWAREQLAAAADGERVVLKYRDIPAGLLEF